MKDEIEKVKDRADKMIGNKKIVTLINEAELITKINDIANNVDETNYYIYDKTLDAIVALFTKTANRSHISGSINNS